MSYGGPQSYRVEVQLPGGWAIWTDYVTHAAAIAEREHAIETEGYDEADVRVVDAQTGAKVK